MASVLISSPVGLPSSVSLVRCVCVCVCVCECVWEGRRREGWRDEEGMRREGGRKRFYV